MTIYQEIAIYVAVVFLILVDALIQILAMMFMACNPMNQGGSQ